jgi:hypothetical protein
LDKDWRATDVASIELIDEGAGEALSRSREAIRSFISGSTRCPPFMATPGVTIRSSIVTQHNAY